MESVAATREDVVLKWSWTVFCVNSIAGLLVKVANPLGELFGVWNGGRKKDVTNIVGEQNDRFFPNDASLGIAHIMDLVKDDPLDFAHDFGAFVKHRSENFCCHDETGGGRVDRHIASHQTDVDELFLQISVFLI